MDTDGSRLWGFYHPLSQGEHSRFTAAISFQGARAGECLAGNRSVGLMVSVEPSGRGITLMVVIFSLIYNNILAKRGRACQVSICMGTQHHSAWSMDTFLKTIERRYPVVKVCIITCVMPPRTKWKKWTEVWGVGYQWASYIFYGTLL